ncbi:MAG: 4-hydroxy-tetrahydrodipicolinate synthase, partial [Burkholderiales bacterium]|nr:4-hydroxy-tetrahydrodipicolinate synthase [Burkholderiales bacterium]
MLRGVLTALATPMYQDGTIDFDSLTSLVLFQNKNRVDGLVVAGSTGEGSLLTVEEKIAVVSHVIKINKGSAKIIIAFNDIATNFAVDFTKKLNDIEGIDYYMATTPAYIRPTQEGLYQHFKAIAKTSRRPIILYNIPSRTACDLDNATILRLALDYPNIVGIKDATANIARACDLFQRRRANFAVYSGDDKTSSDFVLEGGDGVVSVASNLFPGQF